MALDYEKVEKPDGDEPTQKTPQEVASYWLGQISYAEKKRQPFIRRGRQIIKRFKNKRTQTTLSVPMANKRMNVLWSNVQTQKPVLFAQTPKANVSRRNKTKDPVGRNASIVLQNVLQNSLAMEDFDYVMSQVIEDRLLPGSGLAMVEYRPQIEADQVGWQAAETRYLHWEDIITNVARTWQEVWFLGYRVFMTRKEVKAAVLATTGDEELADQISQEITLDHKEADDKGDSRNAMEQSEAKAIVWVIWDKSEQQVLHIATGYAQAPLAVMPPPINFDGFWPCPRPLQSTTSNDSTNPVPDFEQYVDQADEIDLLTQRIAGLTKALRLRGVYAADMESIKELMEAGDNDMIPVENFMGLAERGGLDKQVAWFPVREVAETLFKCIEARQSAIQIMYEVTGISDIMRGATDSAETATAQQLKAQFGGVRIRESQKDVQRFIRDLLRKKAEIICEHFKLEVIQVMSGVKMLTQVQKQTIMQTQQLGQQFAQVQQQYQQMAAQAQQQGMQPPPPPQPPAVLQQAQQALEGLKKQIPDLEEAMEEPTWEEVMAVLRNEKLRGFVVDVETDSTIEPDQQAQQQSATQFVTAVAQFMTAALPIMQAEPDAADFLGELMSWVTRQWKGADTIEGALDEFVEKMKKKAEQPPTPNPQIQADAEKAKADVATAQIGHQTAQVKAQAETTKAQLGVVAAVADHQHGMAERAADMAILQATPPPQPNGGPA